MASLTFGGDFTIPADPASPIIFNLEEHALRLALVQRSNLSRLSSEEWKQPGVYVLIGASQSDDEASKREVYVGKSAQKNGVRGRVMTQHTKPNPGADFVWVTAALFVRSTIEGFNSAQVGYIEGRLAAKLGNIPGLDVRAGKIDTDESLKPSQLAAMDAMIPSFLAGLRLAGLQLEPAIEDPGSDDTVEMGSPGKKRRYSVTISQLVEAGLLAAGDVLVFERKGKQQTCMVTGDGFLVVHGAEYSTPSRAATAAYPGEIEAARGWDVWRLQEDGRSIGDLREEFIALNKPS